MINDITYEMAMFVTFALWMATGAGMIWLRRKKTLNLIAKRRVGGVVLMLLGIAMLFSEIALALKYGIGWSKVKAQLVFQGGPIIENSLTYYGLIIAYVFLMVGALIFIFNCWPRERQSTTTDLGN